MNILVLNCGSSSVKFQFIRMEDEAVLAKGLVEKIGSTGANFIYDAAGRRSVRDQAEVPNHEAAIDLVLSTLTHARDGVIRSVEEVDGVGHRLVHGAEEFNASCLITDEVKSQIEACSKFAPLHNPHNLKGIEVAERLIPGKLQVAVFDTAFHSRMPPESFLYAIPFGLYKKLGIRRYGFHGTSHKFVAQRAAEVLERPLEEIKLITCHLGNGASLAAIREGRSVDTSMGFTPLEGLMMGTRSGDLDPAVVGYLMERENLKPGEVDTILNKRSGLLGITEGANDMREVIECMIEGRERHTLAYRMFCRRVKKYIGAYAALLGGVDALVFTGGIGENSALVRRDILAGLKCLGFELDERANEENRRMITRGRVPALVIPTNEELAIARDAREIIEKSLAAAEGQEEGADYAEELSSLTPADRRELVLLWSADPTANPLRLQERFTHKTGKRLSLGSLQYELVRMGLKEKEESNA